MFDIDKKIKEWQGINIEQNGKPIHTLTRDTVQHLLDGAKLGLKDNLLHSYARISKNTMYEIFRRIPELKELVEHYRQDLKIVAITNIKTKIEEGDVNESKWYLEKTEKETFGNKILNENINIDIVEELSDEEIDNIKKQLRGDNDI